MQPKILVLDIETAPILAYVWKLWDENVGLNQIKSDWHVLSWAAKWVGESKVMYADQRNAKDRENDKAILKQLWELMNEADVVVSQNGKKFDSKKLNARFIIHGFKPPAPYKHIDTLELAKRHFGFTSNRLEYMSSKLCTKYKKLVGHKFPGFELWKECLAGNLEAWKEMERYNKHDVLSTEELYSKLAPWGHSVSFKPIIGEDKCNCGSKRLEKRGFSYTTVGKFQRYQCLECGNWSKSGKNLRSPKDFKRPI